MKTKFLVYNPFDRTFGVMRETKEEAIAYMEEAQKTTKDVKAASYMLFELHGTFEAEKVDETAEAAWYAFKFKENE